MGAAAQSGQKRTLGSPILAATEWVQDMKASEIMHVMGGMVRSSTADRKTISKVKGPQCCNAANSSSRWFVRPCAAGKPSGKVKNQKLARPEAWSVDPKMRFSLHSVLRKAMKWNPLERRSSEEAIRALT